MALPAFAQPRQSSTPPKNLRFIGDHWTAYTPPDPATYPPNLRTHTIVRGDTLWALAQQYYGNAYLWPQLWENNTWITDAHWIYPGDVLLVGGEMTQTAVGMETTTGTTGLGGGESMTGATPVMTGTVVATEVRRESPPVPLGTEADVYCYGYIGDPNEPMPNYVSGFEDVEVMYQPGALSEQSAGVSEGDLIFIAGGVATGLVAGETYMAIEPGELIRHPRTRQVIGRHYNYQGQIRILCTENGRSRAVVARSCREIHLGTRLKPMPQLPIPIARIPDLPGFCETPSGRASGYIIDSLDWDLALAEGNLVQINLGRDDLIQPGDFLTVFRANPIAGQPRQILGELGVLTTEARTATARIVASRRSMFVGDSVELR
ncbi:MAG TPA: LysM peptidoglycan-binding domain-containing protein [Thermoanaerobaculia bacterium]|nr:LysM peptidoglycan-binding domain-containing protein [Thermoanaerobaculia bacterium]